MTLKGTFDETVPNNFASHKRAGRIKPGTAHFSHPANARLPGRVLQAIKSLGRKGRRGRE
jgi:hypothetical protein